MIKHTLVFESEQDIEALAFHPGDFGLSLAQFKQKQVWSCHLYFSKRLEWAINWITKNWNHSKLF